MKLKNNIIMLAAALALSVTSCNYLDVSEQLAGGLQNTDEVFENVNYTKRWYATIFTGIPDYSGLNSTNVDGFKNPWASICDELITGYGNAGNYNNSDKNAANAGFHRYGECYKAIRQANIFLQKAHVITAGGTQGDELLEPELEQMQANARFMRAFYHYLLFEQYGPIAIVGDKVYEATEDLDIPRNSVDEVIEYLDKELLASAGELTQEPITDENYRAWPTKGVALAVRAKMWMYAASPLLNGGFTEALSVANPDGKKLFPAADPNKWVKAKEACKDFIDYANENNRYELYYAEPDAETGMVDPEKSVYELFQKYTNEIIWATATTDWGGLDGDAYDRRIVPRSERNGLGCTSVTQELVDAFYMNDGLPVKATDYLPASPLYTEEGMGIYQDKDLDPINGNNNHYTPVKVSNRFINREPRFYNTVFFSGRQWPVTCNVVQFYNGGNAGQQSGQFPQTGYMLFKRFNRRISKTSPGVSYIFRPSIIFRLADLYLLYAEAANEVDPNDPAVLTYLNKVRNRAGLPDIEDLNPAIKGNKDFQRSAIQRERQIELATEGQRYFDVRRWMIADKDGEGRQYGQVHGMNIRGPQGDEESFYQVVGTQFIVFNRKMYLHPIPDSEIRKSNGNLVQNPGW